MTVIQLPLILRSALAHYNKGEFSAAEPLLRKALKISPRDDVILSLLGSSLLELGRPDDALVALKKSVSINKRNPDAHNNLGIALLTTGAIPEAELEFTRAIKLNPQRAEFYLNLSGLYKQQNKTPQQIELLLEALKLNPRLSPIAYESLAVAYFSRDYYGESINCLLHATNLFPESSHLKTHLAANLIRAGFYEDGWHAYLFRNTRIDFFNAAGIPLDPAPPKLPIDLQGIQINLYEDQGLGDSIFFLRFVDGLVTRGASIIAYLDDRLIGLIERGNNKFECQPKREVINATGPVILAGDLPYLLGSIDEPESIKIYAEPNYVSFVKEKLSAYPKPWIGITFEAGKKPKNNEAPALHKKIDPILMGRLIKNTKGTLFCLQRGLQQSDLVTLESSCGRPVIDLSVQTENLEEATATLELLDDYICVSNTNLHLRDALGKSSVLLLDKDTVDIRNSTKISLTNRSPWFKESIALSYGSTSDWNCLEKILLQQRTTICNDHQ